MSCVFATERRISWVACCCLQPFVPLVWFLKVVVLQGQEPCCFLQIFRGGLIVHKARRGQVLKAGSVWKASTIFLFLCCE